jgi:CTP:molybdopterin cytidylyltransferase MocA
LLAPLGDTTVVGASVSTAVAAGLDATWVVTGAVELDGSLPPGVRVIRNPRWAEGQATSLQSALSAARAEGVSEVVVGLGDQPRITPEAWRAVASAAGPVAVATYHGRRGNPVKLCAGVWDLVPSHGDRGARVLMSERPDLVEEVPCEGDPADIDTREDLSRWS